MSYAKILVPVTGSPTDAAALATAFVAAKPFDAHVLALFVHPDPRAVTPYVYSGPSVSGEIIQSIIDGQQKLADGAAAAALSAVKATARDAGAQIVGAPERKGGTTCSFQKKFGFVPHLVAEAARFADLVVFKAPQKDERPEFSNAIVDTLIQANRPALLSPRQPPVKTFQTIAVGWDGRDAALHAVTAALPFLQTASKVKILVVGAQAVPGCKSLHEFLWLHGVETSEQRVVAPGESVATSLMDTATGVGADLLIIGGYGHSHLRETILGGVTLEVVSHHTLPVFLMH